MSSRIMGAAQPQLAQRLGLGTALSAAIQAIWFRAFFAFWLVLLRCAAQASQNAKSLSPNGFHFRCNRCPAWRLHGDADFLTPQNPTRRERALFYTVHELNQA